MQNYFELFGLPNSFSLDNSALAQTYRALQQAVHPDRFANQGEQAVRLAMQKTAQINDAFATLKSPLLRAEYMLSLAGVELRNEQQTMRDSHFLMQQMEWRETLADLRQEGDVAGLERFSEQLAEAQRLHLLRLADGFERGEHLQQPDILANEVRKLAFLVKLNQEITQAQDALDDSF